MEREREREYVCVYCIVHTGIGMVASFYGIVL